jgi:hypothetical protein
MHIVQNQLHLQQNSSYDDGNPSSTTAWYKVTWWGLVDKRNSISGKDLPIDIILRRCRHSNPGWLGAGLLPAAPSQSTRGPADIERDEKMVGKREKIHFGYSLSLDLKWMPYLDYLLEGEISGFSLLRSPK